MKIPLLPFAVFLVLAPARLPAQDAQFTQFYAAPLYLNPAMTGSGSISRATTMYRNQWPSVPVNFVTYLASYDQRFDRYKSGLGLLLMHDKAGTAFTSSSINLQYAYFIRTSQNSRLRAGLNFGYAFRHLAYNDLVFGDQLDFSGVTGISTAETFNGRQLRYFDFGSGLMWHNERYWMGVSASHLNRPNQSLFFENSELPIKLTFHGGARFILNEDPTHQGGKPKFQNSNRETSVSPAFLYKQQADFRQLDLGVYFYYDPFVMGFWYRGIPIVPTQKGVFNHDAVAFLIGLKTASGLNIGYSYDFTVSELNANTGGAHEISLTYNFDLEIIRKKPRRAEMFIPCPEF